MTDDNDDPQKDWFLASNGARVQVFDDYHSGLCATVAMPGEKAEYYRSIPTIPDKGDYTYRHGGVPKRHWVAIAEAVAAAWTERAKEAQALWDAFPHDS